MLGHLFDAYLGKGLELWRLPNLEHVRVNGGPDLDAIVKGAPVKELMAGNAYLAAPQVHDGGSVKIGLARLFVECFGYRIAIYAFAVSGRIFTTREDGSVIDFNYFEFINAVGKLPNANKAKQNGKNTKSPYNSRL